jgi:poly-gamma-glutamate synthesis protein (capsule biosynthesis protein)
MIASIHVHQVSDYRNIVAGERIGMREGWDNNTPDFLIRLAHDSIDNGADLFVAHGVHSLRGVEIYQGKPVFYGLSNFVFQSGIEVEPHDALLATSHFDNGRLVEVRLYPADLGGIRRPLSRNGIPTTPSPEDAQRILRDVQQYSRPFGTRISIENNIGIIRVASDAQAAAR